MDLFDIIVIALGAVTGAFAGSLVHTLAIRLPAELPDLGSPPCQACGTPLGARGFIPFVPAQCAECGAGWHKPATEAAAALIVALALTGYGLTVEAVTVALFSLVLLTILRIDWQHHLIFTIIIAPGIAIALFGAALQSQSALVAALIAAAGAGLVFTLFFALAVVIYRQQALGFGDILLAILIGAMTGLERVVPALLLGMILAAAGGLFLIAIGQRGRRDYIPYGAYLCLGTMLVLLWPG
jgi:leader peptidase (prepilin peptidase) / N-methyltransferase